MLNRLMLRLAVINALSPQPNEPSPTIANDAIFDSRLDDIEFDEGNVELPIVIVYTEDDENVLQDRGNGWGPSERHVVVRIEIALGSFNTQIEDNVKRTAYGLPSTDAELEGLLDMFEAQVWRAIQHPTRPASTALQCLIIQMDTWHSTASRSADGNNRLAARSVTMRCRIPPDCRPRWTSDPFVKMTEVPVFSDAPYLNPIIKKLSEDPANSSLMDMLREAAGGGPQIFVPPFMRVSMTADKITPASPDVLAILDRSRRPYGTIVAQAEWTISGLASSGDETPYNDIADVPDPPLFP